jgi:hypothetical protein
MLEPASDQGAVLVGLGVIAVVVVAVVGAVGWGVLRLRAAGPILRNSISGVREEAFAAQVLHEFRPEGQVGVPGVSDTGAQPDVGSVAADGEAASVDAATLEDFYATAMTAKPVRAAAPATGVLATPGSHLQVSQAFGVAVRELVSGIRDLAVAVEQSALVNAGSDLERAAHVVGVLTEGLGGLPVQELVGAAGRVTEIGDKAVAGGAS